MWLRLKFSLFGREIWSLEIDEDSGEVFGPLEDWIEDEEDDEEYDEDEDEEEEDDEEALRWGEPHVFVRDITVPQ